MSVITNMMWLPTTFFSKVHVLAGFGKNAWSNSGAFPSSGAASPVIDGLTAENGDQLTTESGDNILWEA